MREKQIFAVPTFAIFEYFAEHAGSAEGGRATGAAAARITTRRSFAKQLAAGVPIAMGSDVGPFPHGTQAREFELMVKYGMTPLAALQAGTLNGAKAARLAGPDRRAEGGLFCRCDRGAGQSARQTSACSRRSAFVMKGGVVYRQ